MTTPAIEKEKKPVVKYLKLPKVYELNKERPEGKYAKFIGVPKLSYSAINSFKEDGYRGEFFSNYFLGIRGEGNVFTSFGSKVGNTVALGVDETGELSDFDVETILKHIPRPENAIYEDEIVIDRGSYIINGFIDVNVEKSPKKLTITDVKTGGQAKKEYYASEEYAQTSVYCHAKFLEGYEIEYSGVHLLHRKGNGNSSHPLRLTGEVDHIPTPYSPERAEKFLLECDYVSKEIEKFFAVYNKYLK